MKVNFYTVSAGNSIQNQGFSNNYSSQSISRMSSLQSDMFVKSANDISFNGVSKKQKIKDVATDLAMIGIIGAPFVLSIGAASYAMSKLDVKDIFLPDGTYLMSVDELKTDKITANPDEGILKIEGTPIDIDASRYDIADVEKGIYKNFDGSVDIDLANNKYIDMEHGVIIDPDSQVSFIQNADGVLENVAIPALTSPNFKGASMHAPNPVRLNPTRSEYIAKHGQKPEDDHVLSNIFHDEERIQPDGYRVVDPDDNRTTSQKIIDFFNPRMPGKNNGYYNLHDRTKDYDVFGREIVTIQKADGSISKIGLDENLKAVLDKYNLKTDSLGEISDFCEKLKMKEYLLEYHPGESPVFKAHTENLTEFLHRITENHQDVADAIAHDAIVDTMTDSDVHTTFIDILQDIVENV